MLRIRLQMPKGESVEFVHQDVLHDSLIHAITATGISSEVILGRNAEAWTFAPLGWAGNNKRRGHTLVVSTSSLKISEALRQLRPENVRYARALTGEMVDFSGATIIEESDVIPPGGGTLGTLMLSPLLISQRGTKPKIWENDLKNVDLSSAVNHVLSRCSGREVRLNVQADSLFLRANPDHAVMVKLKGRPNQRSSFVIGMSAPLVLSGSEEDLRLAWYAGIGEKTHNGFGSLGLAEEGVGR